MFATFRGTQRYQSEAVTGTTRDWYVHFRKLLIHNNLTQIKFDPFKISNLTLSNVIVITEPYVKYRDI